LRPDIEKEAHRLATQKLADKYLGRRGEPPSVLLAKRYGARQDLNEDDRKHLKWCFDQLRELCGSYRESKAAFEFIEAVIDRDYDIYRSRKI